MRLPMQFIRLSTTFVTVMLGVHLLSSCSGKRSSKSSGSGGANSGASEIEVSGSISDEEPLDFVQSSESVAIGGVNLTSATSYLVTAYSVESRGFKKLIFTGSFAESKFSFKSFVARQYIVIEITRLPDGGQFGAVLPPPAGNKKASLVVDGTTPIAAKMASLIASKAASGDQGAQQALSSGNVSVADLLMVSQSVRTTVLEQKAQGKGSAIELSTLTANLISKSNERISKLNAEGQSSKAVAEKLSESSYQTIFGDDAKIAPAGVLAYRVNPDLGSSEAAKATVAYEAIKASVSDSTKAVDEAFRAEATAYRTATSTAAAVAATTTVTSDFKAVFSLCVSSPSSCAQTIYTPPQPQSSAVEPVKAPGAPTAVTGTAGDMQVSLTWTAPANNGGSAITDYVIEYSSNSGSTWVTFSDNTSTSTSASVTGLTNGTSYVFKVAAKNSAGTGNYSGSPSVTPATIPDAPTGVTGTAGNNQVSLNWTAPANNGGSAITGYSIQHSSDSGSTWSGAISTGSTSTSHTVTGLTNGTAYLFRVAAVNALGTGSYSGPSASVTPTPWTEVTVGSDITMRDNATGLWWSNYPGEMNWFDAMSHCENLSYNGQGAGSWRVPTKDELVAAYNNGINAQGRTGWITDFGYFWSSVSDYTDNAWVVDLAYGSTASNGKGGTYQVVCVTNPFAPTAVTSTAGNTEVALTWTPPASNGGSAITNYSIQHSSDSGSTWSGAFSTGSTSTSHTVTGLTNGTVYVFRVAAVNALGTGSYSGPSASVTPAPWTEVTVGIDVTMRDNATGLWWSNYRGEMNWFDAMSHCENLSYNGQGAGSWRVPTKDELVAAYNNGINAQGRTGWITDFGYFWSSVSTKPNNANNAWVVSLAPGATYGTTYVGSKAGTHRGVCVR